MGRTAGYLLAGALLVFGLLFYLVPLFFPPPPGLVEAPERGFTFLDRKGQPIRRFLSDDGLRGDDFVTYADLSPSLILATLAAEDERFFSHAGVDFISTGRALRDALRHGRIVSGASTITQQLVKLGSEDRPRDVSTKLLEIARARNLEFFESKPTILTAYLNRLPYGNQLTGCRAAARRYFAKPVSDLSLAEAAFLAGIPNKPTRFNPYRNLAAAQRRQAWVLSRMLHEELITPEQYRVASAETLLLQPEDSQVFHAPHFIELLKKHHPHAGDEESTNPGKTVRTSLDLAIQDFVENCVSRHLGRLARQSNAAPRSDLQAAVVVIHNATGEVLALTGSRSFFGSDGGQINGAWTPRSPGSTLKPFIYLLALEQGHTTASVLPDIPVEYVGATGSYRPVNFDRRFSGPVSLRHALANSLNVPAVRLLEEIGGEDALHHCLTTELGLSGLKSDPSRYGLGLGLGNAEVRLLELTNAYACLARLGCWNPCHFLPIEPPQDLAPADARRFCPDAVWLIADILSDNEARSEAFGIDSAMRLPFRVACKTGTSTDFRDNWALGFTPEFTVGVWLGSFDRRPLPGRSTGALGAAPIFREVMMRLHEDLPPTWYAEPDNLVHREIDEINGLLVNPDLPFPPRRSRSELFLPPHLPRMADREDYSEQGLGRLPNAYSTWWPSGPPTLRTAATLETPAPGEAAEEFSDRPFRIVSPLAGTVAYIDPDLPAGGRRFPLRFAGTGREQIEWSSPTLRIETGAERSWLLLESGEHEVIAVDRTTGRKATSRFRVELF